MDIKFKLRTYLCFSVFLMLTQQASALLIKTFQPSAIQRPSITGRSRVGRLCMSLDDQYDQLKQLQAALVDDMNNAFQLKVTDFTDAYNVKAWNVGPAVGEGDWLDEVKGSKLTGIASSSYRAQISNGVRQGIAVSGWVGPTTAVPHFVLTVESNPDSSLTLIGDYIHRGPQPVGTDLSYFEQYYNNPQQLEKFKQIHGSHDPARLPSLGDSSFYQRTLQSPNHVHVVVDSIDVAGSFCVEHVRQWIDWINQASPVETRSRGAMNSRDDKLRQFFFAANLHKAQSIIQNDKEFAKLLASGWTGPISEAYVGGGS